LKTGQFSFTNRCYKIEIYFGELTGDAQMEFAYRKVRDQSWITKLNEFFQVDSPSCDLICNRPPVDPGCGKNNTYVTYAKLGECRDSKCHYMELTEFCEFGRCTENGCPKLCDKICDEPPKDSFCDSFNNYHFYQKMGTCLDNKCVYIQDMEPCVFGECTENGCVDTCESCTRGQGVWMPQDGCQELCFSDSPCFFDPKDCPGPCTSENCENCFFEKDCQNAQCDWQVLIPLDFNQTTANITVEEIGFCTKDLCRGVECVDAPENKCVGNNYHSYSDQGFCDSVDGKCNYLEKIEECGEMFMCTPNGCVERPRCTTLDCSDLDGKELLECLKSKVEALNNCLEESCVGPERIQQVKDKCDRNKNFLQASFCN